MNSRPNSVAGSRSDTRVRTLVVDDSPMMFKIMAQILKEAGNFDLVGTATDGWKALRHVAELSPDLVLMDFHMPQLNGIQATRIIKQREHPPVVIVISSDDTSAAKATAVSAGADGFLRKNGDLRHGLLDALHAFIGLTGAGRAEAGSVATHNAHAGHATQGHRVQRNLARHGAALTGARQSQHI